MEGQKAWYDRYNYVIMQCHTCIDMAFEILCKKSGVFWGPCKMMMAHYATIVGVTACLNNLCFNKGLSFGMTPVL